MSTATAKDECYPGCRTPRVRFVCPGPDDVCDLGYEASHRYEVLAPAGARLKCETHGISLEEATA